MEKVVFYRRLIAHPVLRPLVRKLARTDTYEVFRRVRRLFRVLHVSARRQLMLAQLAYVVRDVAATLSVGGFALLLILLNAPELIVQQPQLAYVYHLFGFGSEKDFLLVACAFFVFFLICEKAFFLFATWYSQRAVEYLMRVCSVDLYRYYISLDYEEHLSLSQAEMFTRSMDSLESFIRTNVLMLITLFSATVNVSVVLVFLGSYYPVATVAMAGGIFFTYYVVYGALRKRMIRYGKALHIAKSKRYKFLREGVSGFLEVLFHGKAREFCDEIDQIMAHTGRLKVKLEIFGIAVQPVIVAFGMLFVLGVIGYFVFFDSPGRVFPALAFFVAGGLRLLPAVQSVYKTMHSVSHTTYQFHLVMGDLEKAQRRRESDQKLGLVEGQKVVLEKGVRFENVSYGYQGQAQQAVQNISLDIPAGKVVALCGRSGSGKTTLARLLGGLLLPSEGAVTVDGVDIKVDKSFCRGWQTSIGYMTQNPYFMDDTVAANVSFELRAEAIDREKVWEVLRIAQLDDFVKALPGGLDEMIGEEAQKISGGQMQRISVARALYRDATLLLLDETTSFLDAVTEKKIIDNVLSMRGKKTIVIIAHRLDVMRKADLIFLIDAGQVSACGTYQELLDSSKEFRKLARQYAEEP